MDEDVQKALKEVGRQVSEMRGVGGHMEWLTIEDVLEHLDREQKANEKASEKHAAVREAFSRTLQSIETVGGMLAGTASAVFPPANTCYNALTVVISTWRDYEGIFDSLAALLEKCTDFLRRLAYYYKGHLDKYQAQIVCEGLQLFVEVLDQTLKLNKGGHRVKRYAKVFFLKDDGVQDLLKKMEKLTANELQAAAARGVRVGLDNRDLTQKQGAKLDTMIERQNQKRQDKDMEKRKETVLRVLELDPSMTKDRPWEQTWQKNKRVMLEGTGDWLVENDCFNSWIRGSGDDKPILGVQGKTGSGKTMLASNIIMRLRKINGSRDDTSARSVVAHYFLEPDPKEAQKGGEIAHTVSTTLVWQLAEADDPFMKSIAGICEKSGTFKSYGEMWAELLFKNDERPGINSNFFIILDGATRTNVSGLSNFLKEVSGNTANHRTRVLITGVRETFDTLEGEEGLSINKIVLGKTNRNDIELYINERMDGMEMLKNKQNPDVVRMRGKILETLRDNTDGDYKAIEDMLDKISKTDEVDEINKYLEDAGKPRPQIIEENLERLNRTLDVKDIADINEIILWVNTSYYWLKLNEMEAALALRAGNVSTSRLLPLESKIRKSYNLLFSIEDGIINYDLPEIRNMIPKRKRDAADEVHLDLLKTILPAEVNMVKHYLATVCPPDVYEKFGFDEFFAHKVVQKSKAICQDPDNAHITIALRSMTCIEGQRTEKTESLLDYARHLLCSHLRDTDLSLVDRDLKTEAGKKLVRLFTEEHAIDSFFKPLDAKEASTEMESNIDAIPTYLHSWILTTEGIEVLKNWFKDTAVLEGIKDTDLVKSLISPNDNDFRDTLLGPSSRRIVFKVFRTDLERTEMLRAFVFLAGFLTKASRKKPEKDENEGLEDILQPNLNMVFKVEEWSKKSLEVTETDSLWETRMAILLFYLGGKHITKRDSEIRARKAVALDAENWKATYALAQVVESNKEAIGLLKPVIAKLMGDEEWRREKKNNRELAKMMLLLGDRYWETAEMVTFAVETYLNSLDIDRSRVLHARYFSILHRYGERKQWGAIVSFLDKIIKTSDQDHGMAGIFSLEALAGWDSFEYRLDQTFTKLARNTERWDLVDELYEKALSSTEQYRLKCYLQYRHGVAVLNKPENENSAVAIWEAMLDSPYERTESGKYDRTWVLGEITRPLVSTYLKLASMSGLESITAKTYLKKIEDIYNEFDAMGADPSVGTGRGIWSYLGFARYLCIRGDMARAKKSLKRYAAQDLEMLSDDSIENDYQAYWDLGMIFSTLDDIANARVAWEMMAQSKQAEYEEYLRKKEECEAKRAATQHDMSLGSDPQAQSHAVNGEAVGGPSNPDTDTANVATGDKDASPSTSEAAASPPAEDPKELEEPDINIAMCDVCGRKFPKPSEIWTCKDCGGDVQFDQKCYDRLMNDQLDIKICDKSHDLYRLPKKEEGDDVACSKGWVSIDGKEVNLAVWKAQIKAQYVNFEDGGRLDSARTP